MSTNDAMSDRLEALERQVIRMRRRGRLTSIAALSVVLLIMGVAAVQSPSKQNSTTMRELRLVDKAGKLRLHLNVDDKGEATMKFTDAKGTQRLLLGLLEDGTSRIRLLDHAGNSAISSSTYVEKHAASNGTQYYNGAELNLTGEGWNFDEKKAKNKAKISFKVYPDGEPVQRFRDTKGDERITLFANKDQHAAVIHHSKGKMRTWSGTTPSGAPRLSLYGEDGKLRLEDTVIEGQTKRRFFDKTGKLRLINAVADSGESGQWCYNKDDVVSFSGINSQGQPLLSMYDSSKRLRMRTEVNAGGPTQTLYDSKGNRRVSLYVNKNQYAAVAHYSDGKQYRHWTGTHPTGEVEVNFSDTDGRLRKIAKIDKNRRMSAAWYDRVSTSPRIWIAANSTGLSELDLYGKDKKLKISSTVKSDDSVYTYRHRTTREIVEAQLKEIGKSMLRDAVKNLFTGDD